MNQLAYGEKINVPSGIIRSVSFQKIREGSLEKKEKTIGKENFSSPYQYLLNTKLQQQKPKAKEQRTILTKKELLKKEIEQKQMKECSFHPTVRTNGSIRTIDEFIKQQDIYRKDKECKVRELRQLIQQKNQRENTFKPNGIQQRSDTQIYQRLYEDGVKKLTNRKQSEPNSIAKTLSRGNSKRKTSGLKTFSRNPSINSFSQSVIPSKQLTNPKPSNQTATEQKVLTKNSSKKSINSHRGINITKCMDVQEVCERKLRIKDQLGGCEKGRNVNIGNKQSLKNKQIYIKKILKEICFILAELKLNKYELNLQETSLILQKMNFIEEQTSENEKKYLLEIWQMLQGDIYQTINLTAFIKVIFSLLGAHDCTLIENHLKVALPQENKRSLMLTQKDSKNIKNKFQMLAMNRLQKGEYLAHGCKEEYDYSFHPFISKHSEDMAERYRKRILQETQQMLNNNLIKYKVSEDGVVNHIDLLMLDQKRKEAKIQKLREEKQKQKELKEVEAMKPQKSHRCNTSRDPSVSEKDKERDIFAELYEHGKEQKKMRNKNYENQQKDKQCFRPSKRVYSKENSLCKEENSKVSLDDIRDFDKSVFRMYQGRRLRDESHYKSSERSIATEFEQNHVSQSCMDDPSPILYLNVDVEECQPIKIPVFEADNMRTITRKVREMAGLLDSNEQKLQEILSVQIIPALKQYGLIGQ